MVLPFLPGVPATSPVRHHFGVQELRVDRLQISVPVRAIDYSVKLRRQMHGLRSAVQLEVRDIGGAVNHNVVQHCR